MIGSLKCREVSLGSITYIQWNRPKSTETLISEFGNVRPSRPELVLPELFEVTRQSRDHSKGRVGTG